MGLRLHVRSSWAPRDGEEAVYEFDQDRILIGRGRGADVCLPHRTVSLRHATIELTPRGYAVTDHETTNGTRVSLLRLVPGRPKPLRDGDRIDISGFEIVVRSSVAVSSPTSSERTGSLARKLVRDARQPDEPELSATLTILNGPQSGARFVLPEPPARVVIGRDESCDIRLNDADASREHAELRVEIDGVRVRDLGSKNGVVVGGRALRERVLGEREELRIGSTVLAFEDAAGVRVRELEQGGDVPYDPPVAPAAPELTPDEHEELPPEPEPAPAPKPRASIATADIVIYVLAAAVFAISVLGLLWLLQG